MLKRIDSKRRQSVIGESETDGPGLCNRNDIDQCEPQDRSLGGLFALGKNKAFYQAERSDHSGDVRQNNGSRKVKPQTVDNSRAEVHSRCRAAGQQEHQKLTRSKFLYQ